MPAILLAAHLSYIHCATPLNDKWILMSLAKAIGQKKGDPTLMQSGLEEASTYDGPLTHRCCPDIAAQSSSGAIIASELHPMSQTPRACPL